MVGKKITLRRILGVLREAGIVNVRTTEFLQGRTTRWGVGWSFSTDGLAELQVRPTLCFTQGYIDTGTCSLVSVFLSEGVSRVQ